MIRLWSTLSARIKVAMYCRMWMIGDTFTFVRSSRHGNWRSGLDLFTSSVATSHQPWLQQNAVRGQEKQEPENICNHETKTSFETIAAAFRRLGVLGTQFIERT